MVENAEMGPDTLPLGGYPHSLWGAKEKAERNGNTKGGSIVNMNTRGFVLALGTAFFSLMAISAPSAFSATINVTANATDTLNGANAQCSLREAITNINNGGAIYADCVNTGGIYGTSDTINIPAGTYTTLISGATEDANVTGDYDINLNVSIVGTGASTTIINGGALDRVFHITGGFTVTISGVTIQNGNLVGAGGGIYNSGTLTVTNSTISGNTASTSGGGINNNFATLTVNSSTISGNTASVSGGGIASIGSTSALTVTNSTIAGNTAPTGGGINNPTGSSALTVTNSTISNNTAATTGGGINNGGTATLSNTIVANQVTGADCSGTITSTGYNLESSTSCGFVGTGDLQNTNPLLGALASNGGPTQTMALLSNSPAINAGSATCAAAPVNGVDQRGTVRPQGAGCDIGAFEAVTYTVTYGGNGFTGGSVPVDGSSPYPSGATVTVLGNTGTLVKTGYTFAGWNTAANGSGTSYAPAATFAIAGDMTLYAQWTIISTWTVTKTADTNDGVCDADCSLREAISAANTGSGSDTINIPAGTYTTTLSGVEDLNATGDYDISKGVTIVGAGASSTTITGGGLDRVFHITGSYTVSIHGVTITNGNSGGASGGGILNNSGTLTITNSTLSGNTAGMSGGAIFNGGTLTITNSTITDNTTINGGGILNNSGTLTITNSTITSNSAAWGGGIFNNNGTLTITNSTITSNSAGTAGGGIYRFAGTVTLSNSIVASQTLGADCSGTITSNGHNLESATSCGFTGTGDLQNTNPLLGALADNGGLTQTMALQPDPPSPAVDAGSCVQGADQRGIARPQGTTCDIGAYEVVQYLVSATAGTGGSVTPASTNLINDIGIIWVATGFIVTANSGYTTNTTVGGTCPAGHWSGTMYITGAVTADCSVSFSFTQNSYTVSASAGTGGSVTPSTQNVNYGSTASFTVTPDTGCTTGSVTGCGGALVGTTYTTGAITGACAVSATFTINSYTVSATAGTGGTITPASQNVNHGSTTTFTVTPDTGYSIGSVTGCGGTLVGTTYTTGAITGACTVSATFTINSYMVSASSGSGGTITPASQNVNYGSTASFTVTPNTGYTASVGGTCPAGSLTGAAYTTGAVTGACTVNFTFTAVPIGTLTVTMSPAEAVTAGAQWRVDGGAWMASGATVAGLTAGAHTVSFSSVDTYTSPANQPVTITLGQTTTATGTYTAVAGTGSLKVTISPATASADGAQWSVDGGTTWNVSGVPVTDLPAGSYTLSFGAVAGYTTPEDKVVAITNGRVTTATGTYKQDGSLTVNISPQAAIDAGAQWSVDGGTTWNNNGDTVTGLAVGKHTVTFKTEVAGYSPPANKTVTITQGRVTRATGIYTTGYTVSAKASTGGSVTPAKKVVTDTTTPVALKVTAKPGYTMSATYGGTCPAGTWDATTLMYTIDSVTEACTVTFTFTKAPTVTPGSATNIVQAGATLNAKVNPENASTTVTFEYGADTNYGTTVSAGVLSGGVAVPLTGGTAQPVAAPVTGLTCNRTYHYRVVAVNAVNTTPGADRTFKTAACKAPIAATVGASNVTATGATLKGVVNPNKASTTVTFEYVADSSVAAPTTYGSTVSAGTLTGGASKLVSAAVTGLDCGTKYHFRVKAVNAVNPANGLDKTFTTTTLACADSADSNMVKALVSDLDGDGKSDIVFRDVASGQTAVWMMNGASVTSNALTSITAGAYTSITGWQAQGIGDFDGDGKNDLLWRDAESGQLAVWMMNGSTVVTSATTNVNPGAGWHVQGIGDFNGDGKSDILFRNVASGETSVWFMNGAVKIGGRRTSSTAGAYTSTTGWQVHGVGDFNGDGKSDILWRHAGTGKTIVWFMNGYAITSRGQTTVQAGAYTATTGWQVQGAGDFNGDGKADILWRDSATGRMAIWFMNGAKVSSGSYTSVDAGSYTSTTGLHVSAIADYDGDGKSDILLRDAETGQTRVWVMNGSQATSDAATDVNPGVYTSATGWSVVSEETVW